MSQIIEGKVQFPFMEPAVIKHTAEKIEEIDLLQTEPEEPVGVTSRAEITQHGLASLQDTEDLLQDKNIKLSSGNVNQLKEQDTSTIPM